MQSVDAIFPAREDLESIELINWEGIIGIITVYVDSWTPVVISFYHLKANCANFDKF